jgi:hypothetical protein
MYFVKKLSQLKVEIFFDRNLVALLVGICAFKAFTCDCPDFKENKPGNFPILS